MKDLFSTQAAGYAAFRPTYPADLYKFILKQVRGRHQAWDCATGNGQVARDLAPHFNEVHATDASITQIKNAVASANIFYSVAHAESTGFPDSSFDLVTVGQALHWFNISKFYDEVNRVAKKDAVIAVWGYGLLTVEPAIDAIINDFYVNVIGPYWDNERKLIDDHYSTVAFPFRRIDAPEFQFSVEWSFEELIGYLGTWSSVQKYIQARQVDPVQALSEKLRPLCNSKKMPVTFPLFLLCGIVGG
jgi:ubiquinone/menaquinone biosynthesis C-methylase UbiE